MAIGNRPQPGGRGGNSGGRPRGDGRANARPKPKRDADFEESDEDIKRHRDGQEAKDMLASNGTSKIVIGVIAVVVIIGIVVAVMFMKKPSGAGQEEPDEGDFYTSQDYDDGDGGSEDYDVDGDAVSDDSGFSDVGEDWDDTDEDSQTDRLYDDDGNLIYEDGVYVGKSEDPLKFEDASNFTKDLNGANVPQPGRMGELETRHTYADYTLHKAFYGDTGSIMYWVELKFDGYEYIQQISAETALYLKAEGICEIDYELFAPKSGGYFITHVEVNT